LDLVKLQRLILGLDEDLAPNTSWRFVDKDHVFSNPNAPWGFPEVIDLQNMQVDEMQADFIGVKIGDVNDSAEANSLLGAQSRNMQGSLDFEIEEQKLQKDGTYDIEVRSSNFNTMLGYQYTMEVRDAQIVEVIPGSITTEDNFAILDNNTSMQMA